MGKGAADLACADQGNLGTSHAGNILDFGDAAPKRGGSTGK
jgi:hypothetical protein